MLHLKKHQAENAMIVWLFASVLIVEMILAFAFVMLRAQT